LNPCPEVSMRNWFILFFFVFVLTACTSTGSNPTATLPAPEQSITATPHLTGPITEQIMKITSPAFNEGQPIPPKFTCQGENISPALVWSGAPDGTKSLALVTEDPDAPSGTFIHWVIYNMPPGLTGLPEKVPASSQVSGTGAQGITSSGRPGYTGPCPPSGKPHRYFFKLYALDLDPQLPAGLNAASLQKQMVGHILAQAQWMGTFQR
jgi:Raf kinase inhibitor-like YbhB/YbcL family protein